MRIGIIGGGAVARFLCVRLARAHCVNLVVRDESVSRAISERGLRLLDSDSGHVEEVPGDRVRCDTTPTVRCDVVLVCTKGVVPRRAAYDGMIGDETLVVPLVNGIEHLHGLVEDYGASKAAVGCIRVFADSGTDPNGVLHATVHGVAPQITCGRLGGGDLGVLEEAFRDTGVSVRVVPNIREEMWRKFVFIVATSAIGASSRAPLQRVCTSSAASDVLLSILRECSEVAAAACGTGIDAQAVHAHIRAMVGSAHRDVTTSLQRDVMAGRASEIDEQLGAMLRAAARHGVDVPTLRALHGILDCNRMACLPSAPPRMPVGSNEATARRDLAACHRLLAKHGMDDTFVTHASLRIPGEESFLISPFGILFEQVTASSLIKVALDGTVLSACGVAAVGNETAVRIHAPLQRAGHAAVVHTHTAAGNAVASSRRGLMPWTQKALLVIPFIRYHDYGALALGDDSEGVEMANALADGDGAGRVLVLRHHGLLTVGRTMGEAFLWMEWMERACAFQTAAAADATSPPEHECARTYMQSRSLFGQGGKMAFDSPIYWDSLVRSLCSPEHWET